MALYSKTKSISSGYSIGAICIPFKCMIDETNGEYYILQSALPNPDSLS
jgi:hypothetical protein